MPKHPTTNPPKPTRARGGRKPTYDWSHWRRLYMRGDDSVSLESLSRITDAPSLAQLKRRSSAEDWPGLRAELRAQSAAKLAEADRDLKVEIRRDHLRFARALRAIAVRGMAHLDPAKLGDAGVYRLGKLSTDVERKAAGMEELNIRHGRIRKPEDLDNLSEAELFHLAGLLPPEEDDDDF